SHCACAPRGAHEKTPHRGGGRRRIRGAVPGPGAPPAGPAAAAAWAGGPAARRARRGARHPPRARAVCVPPPRPGAAPQRPRPARPRGRAGGGAAPGGAAGGGRRSGARRPRAGRGGPPPPPAPPLPPLQDRAPPMSAELAARVVTQELGLPPERAFARWDPVPIAAASIGQVHRAIARDGLAVAVKVQYPGIAETMAADLDNVSLLRKLLRLTAPS